MASKQRIQTLKDVGELKDLLKTHVQVDPTTCQLFWQHKATEEVAEKYVDFLEAVAKTGNVLSRKVLARALNATYEGDRASLDAFAKCMVHTLSDIRAKLKMLRGGAKTCDAVVKVCEAWPSAGSSSSLLRPSAGSSSSLESPALESPALWLDEVVSSEPESEDVVSVGDEPTEADVAKAALVNAMALFGTGETPMQRSLAKEDSILSVGSSQPTSPKAADVEDAMLDIKADHPLLTPGAFMYRGSVVLESWLRGWALIRAVQEMRAPVN